MSENKTQSTVPPTYRGSVQLNLDNRAATPTEVCLVKIQPGTKGDLVGRLRSGKVVILNERDRWVEGYALVELTEEREKVAFGKKAVFCIKPKPGSGFAIEFHPQPSMNFSAPSADQFLAEFREALSASVDFFEKTEFDRKASIDAAQAKREGQRNTGRELAGELGESFVKLLQEHDWYYPYSDDSRAFQKGKTEEREIEGEVKVLVRLVGKEKTQELWDMVAPKDCRMPAAWMAS